MSKLVSRQEEQRRTREAHRQHRKFFTKQNTMSKQTHLETTLQLQVRDKWKGRLPLDALEGAAGHVHNAACRSSDHAHQAFTNALKETCCSFLLRPCRDIIQTTIRSVLPWFNSGFTMFLLHTWASKNTGPPMVGPAHHCDFLTNAVDIFMPSIHHVQKANIPVPTCLPRLFILYIL